MKHIDTLFNIFPRDIGIPFKDNFYRKKVNCLRDLLNYISVVNGSGSGVFVSIYDITNNPVIDKVVFDLDSKNLDKSLADTKTLVKRIEKEQLQYLCTFSGRKGHHVYILLKPQKLRRDVAGFYIKELQQKLSKGIKSVDPHLIGDVSRMIRIPQTLNNKHYCTFLPPEFKEWNINQVLKWSIEPHELQIHGTTDYQTIEEAVGEVEIKEYKETVIDDIKINGIPPLEDLHLFIRPCVLEEMLHPVRKDRGPFHITRMNITSELMFLGHTKKQVLDIFRLIHSKYPISDFDEDRTMYQISKIFENKIKPYGCLKLKEQLPCTNCGWKYMW